MKNFDLRYASFILDGQQTTRMSQAKSASFRSIKASELISSFIEEKSLEEHDECEVRDLLSKIKKETSSLDRKAYEKEVAGALFKSGKMDDVPSVIGLDINYYTSGVDVYEYRADESLYSDVFSHLRKASLVEGEMDEEAFLMLWLLRECYLSSLVTKDEKIVLEKNIESYISTHAMASIVWQSKFRSPLEYGMADLIKKKQELFSNGWMQGLAQFASPLEKQQSIFIDMIVLGTDPAERMSMLVDFVRKRGHRCERVNWEGSTILKIDNGYYKLFPETRVYKLPVQGVSLIPVYDVTE